jgi:hypothetical protein
LPAFFLNATRLYPLLERIQTAKVVLFFFHGDDFDPGGRGDGSRNALARRGVPFAVFDGVFMNTNGSGLSNL